MTEGNPMLSELTVSSFMKGCFLYLNGQSFRIFSHSFPSFFQSFFQWPGPVPFSFHFSTSETSLRYSFRAVSYLPPNPSNHFYFKMFGKLFNIVVIVSALVAGVTAKPVQLNRLTRGDISFNNWHGISSFDGFDNFYGTENFIGSIQSQTVVEQDKELVCHTESIEIIQQRLLVLQEMAKRIISEQVCEVETQTVVFEQFHSSLGLFSHDLRRTSGHHVGFDSSITSHFSDFFAEDGSLSTDDFDFTGRDVGSSTVVVGGSNWDAVTSPASVGAAFSSARGAFYASY